MLQCTQTHVRLWFTFWGVWSVCYNAHTQPTCLCLSLYCVFTILSVYSYKTSQFCLQQQLSLEFNRFSFGDQRTIKMWSKIPTLPLSHTQMSGQNGKGREG